MANFEILDLFAFSVLVPTFEHKKESLFFFPPIFIFILKSSESGELPGQKAINPSSRCCSAAYGLPVQDNTPELLFLQKCFLLAEATLVALMCVQVFVFLLSLVITAQAAASSASCSRPHLCDI